jgi:hypothetical protein
MEVKSEFTSCCCFVTNNRWLRPFALGYWLFYFSSFFVSDEERKSLQVKDCLKWVCILPIHTLAFIGDSQFLWQLVVYYVEPTCCWLNHGEAHEVNTCFVFAFKSVLPYEVYTYFNSTWLYFCLCFFWQDLQDLMLLDGMRIPFQYITDFIVSLRHEWLGYWK